MIPPVQTKSGMMICAVSVYRRRERSESLRATRKMLAFSILYLFALFATLLVEVSNNDRGAFAREANGGSPAHPAGRARNHCDFVIESSHVNPHNGLA